MSMNQGICDSDFTESWFLLIANEDNELLRACPMVTNQLTRSTIVFEFNLTWDLEFSLARVVTSIANRHTGDCIRIQPLSLMPFWETRVMWPGYHFKMIPSNWVLNTMSSLRIDQVVGDQPVCSLSVFEYNRSEDPEVQMARVLSSKAESITGGCIRIQLWVVPIYEPRLKWSGYHCQRFSTNCLWRQRIRYALTRWWEISQLSHWLYSNTTFKVDAPSVNQGLCDLGISVTGFLLIAFEDNELGMPDQVEGDHLSRCLIVLEYNLSWDQIDFLARIVRSIS